MPTFRLVKGGSQGGDATDDLCDIPALASVCLCCFTLKREQTKHTCSEVQMNTGRSRPDGWLLYPEDRENVFVKPLIAKIHLRKNVGVHQDIRYQPDQNQNHQEEQYTENSPGHTA